MADEIKPKLEVVHPTPEELDEEEKEFRTLRRDLPGVKGASAAGIITISVAKTPGKNEFFRTHSDFRPVVPARRSRGRDGEAIFRRHRSRWSRRWPSIGITVTNHALYFTVTASGKREDRADSSGRCRRRAERVRHAPRKSACSRASTLGSACSPTRKTTAMTSSPRRLAGLVSRSFPTLKPAKIFRLAFRDKGRLIDSPEHALFQKWAARDRDRVTGGIPDVAYSQQTSFSRTSNSSLNPESVPTWFASLGTNGHRDRPIGSGAASSGTGRPTAPTRRCCSSASLQRGA